MCHSSCVIFAVTNLKENDVKGKKILEIGSYDVNGSVRKYFESFGPKCYYGVDITEGPCVDEICDAENVLDRFGPKSFDIVILTEVLEHVTNWQKVISSIKGICKDEGIILITTRSLGFPYHPTPLDVWRFSIENMRYIFSDFDIISLEIDNEYPGVFMKAKKPKDFLEKNLNGYKLHNMITGTEKANIEDNDFKKFHFIKIHTREELRKLFFNVIKSLKI